MLEAHARRILLSLPSRAAEDCKTILLKRRQDRLMSLSCSIAGQETRAMRLLRRPKWQHVVPVLRRVAKADIQLWEYLRNLLSSAPWRGRVGRLVRYFCVDSSSDGILGVADLGSEVMTLGPRDQALGWSLRQRTRGGGLRRVINLGTCVPSQPFGWLCGGKFIAEACVTREIWNVWQTKYDDAATICCTTSLYGRSSQYNRLPHWRFLGLSAGTIPHTRVDDKEMQLLRRFLSSRGRRGRNFATGLQQGSDSGADVVTKAASLLGIKLPTNGDRRGCYMAEFYPGAVDDTLSGDQSDEPTRTIRDVSAWWETRWRSMRLPKVSDKIASFDWRAYSLKYQRWKAARANPIGSGRGSTDLSALKRQAHG